MLMLLPSPGFLRNFSVDHPASDEPSDPLQDFIENSPWGLSAKNWQFGERKFPLESIPRPLLCKETLKTWDCLCTFMKVLGSLLGTAAFLLIKS